MNHSSLCLHQSHACERKEQRTETKRRREMDGEGEDDRNLSLAWYEWRDVEYRSVFPAGFLLSQFILLMFLGAVLLIVHFSAPICRRRFQRQVHNAGLCVSVRLSPSVTPLLLPLDAAHPNFDPLCSSFP